MLVSVTFFYYLLNTYLIISRTLFHVGNTRKAELFCLLLPQVGALSTTYLAQNILFCRNWTTISHSDICKKGVVEVGH